MISLTRDRWPVEGQVFVAMPYGRKTLGNGREYDFDRFFDVVLDPAIRDCGMKAVRADNIFGPQAVGEAIWRGIQEAELVLVDFTGKSANVALEYGWAQVLGKRMVIITMDSEDIPTDLRGYRYIRYERDEPLSILQMVNELKATIEATRKEPAHDMLLMPMPGPGLEATPARIVSVEKDFVTIEALDHSRRAVLAKEDVTYTRLVTDMRQRFSIGQIIEGAFEIDLKGVAKYTLVGGQKNPWPELVTTYKAGSTVSGVIRNVTDFGVFVEIIPGINGMISKALIPPQVQVWSGAEVEVVITTVEAEKRQIALRLAHRFVTDNPRRPIANPATNAAIGHAVGDELEGKVVRVAPEKGFALIQLDDASTALLHVKRMTADLKFDFLNGALDLGETLLVKIVAIDRDRSRIELADVAEEAEESSSDTIAA